MFRPHEGRKMLEFGPKYVETSFFWKAGNLGKMNANAKRSLSRGAEFAEDFKEVSREESQKSQKEDGKEVVETLHLILPLCLLCIFVAETLLLPLRLCETSISSS
jgi:hypothetical protein